MNEFLIVLAGLVLAMVAISLVRALRGPGNADRMMAAQILGTGGVASLLMIDATDAVPGVADVALGLALLAAFASVAFVLSAAPSEAPNDHPASER